MHELTHLGFKQSKHDYSLFIKKYSGSLAIAAVIVDDIIVTSTYPTSVHSLKAHLNKVFSIKDLGKLHFFLGIEVNYTSDSITLNRSSLNNFYSLSGFLLADQLLLLSHLI